MSIFAPSATDGKVDKGPRSGDHQDTGARMNYVLRASFGNGNV